MQTGRMLARCPRSSLPVPPGRYGRRRTGASGPGWASGARWGIRPPRPGLDATGTAAFLRVADVQLGGAGRGDRAARGPLQLQDHRGCLQARATAGADHWSRSHGQAFQGTCVPVTTTPATRTGCHGTILPTCPCVRVPTIDGHVVNRSIPGQSRCVACDEDWCRILSNTVT